MARSLRSVAKTPAAMHDTGSTPHRGGGVHSTDVEAFAQNYFRCQKSNAAVLESVDDGRDGSSSLSGSTPVGR